MRWPCRRETPAMRKKFDLDQLLDNLRQDGFEPTLPEKSYRNIIDCGFQERTLTLAFVAMQIAYKEKPQTLRGLLYRTVSAGRLPSTDTKYYNQMKRVTRILREDGVVPFRWIVDNVRVTEKPNSWSGLADFMETVQDAYRMDFWAKLDDYVHTFVEKDAVAGTVAPVTRELDVALSPIRGYASLSFAHEIAEQWNAIKKPIFAYYAGDWDASGLDIERDLKEKLTRYCKRKFHWKRLAVNKRDFAAFNLIPLKPKKKDARYQRFVEKYGYECAEVDALPATELRRRFRRAIMSHIPPGEWERLQRIEEAEKRTLLESLKNMNGFRL
jgi:hypothetical protein